MSKPPLHSNSFQNRIKRIMQSDEDVGKVAAASTLLVSVALESFLNTLMDGALDVASSRNARTLTTSHLKASVAENPVLDFCKEATAHAPDLPPPGAEETAPKVKRRRTTTTQSAEGAPAPKRQPKKSKKAIEMDAGESEMDEGDIPVAVLELVAGGGGTGAAGGEDAGPSGDGVADAQFDAAVFDAAPGREAEEEDYDE